MKSSNMSARIAFAIIGDSGLGAEVSRVELVVNRFRDI
jgi:hypothetical protein